MSDKSVFAHRIRLGGISAVAEVSRQAFVWVASQGDTVSETEDRATCQE